VVKENRPRLLALLCWLAVLAFGPMSGCWLAVGVVDRSSCPYIFTETATRECQTCITDRCCAQLGACASSVPCMACISDPRSCVVNAAFTDLEHCARSPNCYGPCYQMYADSDPVIDQLPSPYASASEFENTNFTSPSGGSCAGVGANYGRVLCDPVTNVPCQEGDACSIDLNIDRAATDHTVRFSCRGQGHVLAVGALCGLVEGQCVPGSDCFNGRCYRYCCDPSDCGVDSECELILTYSQICLGVCVAKGAGAGTGTCYPPPAVAPQRPGAHGGPH